MNYSVLPALAISQLLWLYWLNLSCHPASVFCSPVVCVGEMEEHNGEVVTEKLPMEWTLLHWESGSSCCKQCRSESVNWAQLITVNNCVYGLRMKIPSLSHSCWGTSSSYSAELEAPALASACAVGPLGLQRETRIVAGEFSWLVRRLCGFREPFL